MGKQRRRKIRGVMDGEGPGWKGDLGADERRREECRTFLKPL